MGTWQIERYGIPTEEKHYRIEPIYDECLFIEDKQTDEFWVRPSKVAIRNKGKWALINRYESPNMEDINFKYNSFDEIQEFINKEFFLSLKADAEKGVISAYSSLANCYENGIGVQKDEKEAAKWFELARLNLPFGS